MLDLGSYLLGALELAVVAVSLGLSAHRLRARLLPTWHGAPARLVEAITAIALLIWISELLGTLQLFYAGAVVALSLVLAGVILWWTSRSNGDLGPEGQGAPAATGPAGRSALALVMWAVVAIVVAHWSITTQHALDRGIFNFDSLWYHLPFAVDMVQTHSVVGMHHVETVFTNWFYPQNSELLHAVGILLTGRDALSLFLNFGWLGVAFLAAWCVGRPYGRGPLTVVAAAILLECHTLVVRDPGAAKNDLAAAALVLAAIAILVEAWAQRRPTAAPPPDAAVISHATRGKALPRLEPGWALAAAGLAIGLAAGTRVTVLAMAGALSVTVIVLAPKGRRWAAAAWWFLPALAGGAFWYLRNLVVAGNPLPEVERLGPISLPHPERLQEGRPDFSIVHYATDTGVWRHYFAPGLHQAFGALWPLVVLGAAAAALWALLRGRDTIVRWLGGVALFGLLAYLFTPLSAAGAEGEPVGFGINIRYVVPALLAGIVLVPLPRVLDAPRRQWWLMGALVVVLLLTDRPDAVVHDRARLFAVLVVLLAVAVPAALLFARGRGASAAVLLGGFAALALAVVALGYPAQRHYLRERFRNQVADESIPGMDLDSAYRWARDQHDARIGLVGTTAGFAGYGFYGTDLSNHVHYLGVPGHPDDPVRSPETRWLRGEGAVRPILREGPVTVWKVRGRLDPAGCGAANAPLREIPNTPAR
jgi:hypothetical protein